MIAVYKCNDLKFTFSRIRKIIEMTGNMNNAITIKSHNASKMAPITAER